MKEVQEVIEVLRARGMSAEEILEVLESDYTPEQMINGYIVSVAEGSTFYLNDVTHIEAISVIGRFEGDEQACIQAEKDGVKFINDMDYVPKRVYIDTKENREKLEKYIANDKYSAMIKLEGEITITKEKFEMINDYLSKIFITEVPSLTEGEIIWSKSVTFDNEKEVTAEVYTGETNILCSIYLKGKNLDISLESDEGLHEQYEFLCDDTVYLLNIKQI